VINASLWDVFSTALSKCKKEQLIENKSIIKPLIYALYLDDNFNNSITLGTNEVRRVNYRFRKINDLIEEIFDADPIEFE
jgi:hypothetical protein